jgi:hypothetical protein
LCLLSTVRYSYPAGWSGKGLGQQANLNGKVIASRAYFRY